MRAVVVIVMASFAAALLASGGAGAREIGDAIEATTTTGDKVLLHRDGRWEYADKEKAAAAAKAHAATAGSDCPRGSQGGFFGFGRCIPPGDMDYNRGSLNPNRR